MTVRVCSCCKQELELFHFVRRTVEDPDVCKPCRLKRSRRAYNAKNKGRWKETKHVAVARWKAENPDKVKQYRKISYERDPTSWYVAAKLRKKDELRRTPLWDDELTRLVYAEAVDLRRKRATATGIVWEIDHVIPLRGKKVSGFHVWNNLQVIPQTVNRRKYNNYDIL
jgi:hypothetical protein